ncbi:SoxR reducing system RseC family protein [Zymomonas mobilis]|uniref:Positive regulator of sigma E, RseC/MucC n=1 Tax=Zymomonas mobilis subsp. pomaceae (strain ATCC 29192 / DSM 22645 / JCM 10191 / CCUG 17912 / NBRC 13757 / NCIMB 11200 / NRRL B-4491 / Barker I) TaxID=579138 RepID=F8EUM6_ZYMMT|nr:SoxR reducing system RseC family protein [Zymomonas mobilis]AEI38172.1 positive regulator of sigma E, RseC/MucC [Zymomonas mobilis subsp. pomaceae ATCC 29192]MDX5947862.1 SoxR reducing system RseC family protein [Zymomonas mobilis subsp. pomaceae]GEB90091.1 hypothetical protein ZMO02_17280 [Zymomonas mobilis subsp. pomaceae]
MSGDFSVLPVSLPDHLPEQPANDLESCAHVVALEGDVAWFEPDLPSGCAGCNHSVTCVSALTKQSPSEMRRFSLPNDQHFQMGEQIIVAVPAATLVKTALFSYGVPLLTLFIFALVAKYSFGAGDGGAALASLLGLVCGFFCVSLGNRYFAGTHHSKPHFVRRVADQPDE